MAQRAHMQALPAVCGASRAARAISAGSMRVSMHQHGGCGCPVAWPISMAQRLSPPHSGQRVASTESAAGMRHCHAGARFLRIPAQAL